MKNKIFEEQYSNKSKITYNQGPFLYRLLKRFEVHRVDKVGSLIEGKNLDVLEIGFSNGKFLDSNMDKWKSITAVDIVGDFVKSAQRKKYPIPTQFIKADFGQQKMSFPSNSFDSVVIISTIQFMYDLNLLFKEIHRVLRKNGKFIVEFPNTGVLWRRLKFLFGFFPTTSNFTNTYDGGTIHYFTKSSFTKFCNQQGFSVTKITCSGIGASFRGLYPSMLGADLIFICKKNK